MSEHGLEERVRQLEVEQAGTRRTLSHIDESLRELKDLMRQSVELQQQLLSHDKAIERAFQEIERVEKRVEVLNSKVENVDDNAKKNFTKVSGEVSGYVNKVKGAMWMNGVTWIGLIGIAGLLYKLIE